MSAISGIAVDSQLASVFATANTDDDVRFIKVSIRNESLVWDRTIPVAASFEDDLALLQAPDVLEDSVPAYILAKVAPSDWINISYVPDSAKVRDKMLYASTRASLSKAFGSTLFSDAIFATSKADLTPDAYASHKRHIAAPKPLSAREQELADVRAAESGNGYEGSRARASHLRTGVGYSWAQDLRDALVQLGQAEGGALLVLGVDSTSGAETLTLKSSNSETTVDTLGSALPPAQPCYALFAWPHTYFSPPKREIRKPFKYLFLLHACIPLTHMTMSVFIYSCPSTSPIKDRMIYSSGVLSTYQAVKALLSEAVPNVHLASRRIETSDPEELNEKHLKVELGLAAPFGEQSNASTPREGEEKKPFARPRGPVRKR
ncbi:hypothetical protein DXG03_002688 [Asterophora parasitica]|uniref:ADF-H domain-containing protein n=1 Tax=Asterophora parasitica TaxID=117018 RepID=A0A9P7GDI0_9AGAR|nr:hypothetical protein DXG03_002688 [Asterophora parasitica]